MELVEPVPLIEPDVVPEGLVVDVVVDGLVLVVELVLDGLMLELVEPLAPREPEAVPLPDSEPEVEPLALVVALVPLFIEEPETPVLVLVDGDVPYVDELLVDGELPYVDELLVSVPVEDDDGVVTEVLVEDAGAWVVAVSLFLFFLKSPMARAEPLEMPRTRTEMKTGASLRMGNLLVGCLEWD